MKHLYTIVLLLTLFCNCQKSNNAVEPSAVRNSLITSLKQWIESEKKQTTVETSQRITSVQQKINWQDAYLIHDNGDSLLVVPYGKKSHRTNSKQLVAKIKRNRIQEASILVVVTLQIERLNEILLNYEKPAFTNFKVSIDKVDISYRPIEFREYDKGLTKLTKLVGKDHKTGKNLKLSNLLLKQNQTCIDWYLITYYGDVILSEQYLFTTCQGTTECNVTRQTAEKLKVELKINCGDEGNTGGYIIENTGNGPKICRSSFQFKPQGTNSITNIAAVWGIPAGYDAEMGGPKITFGLQVWEPTDIINWNGVDHLLSWGNYFSLWYDGDINSYTDAEGIKHYTFSKYAQQVITADATDYAALHADEKILMTDPVNGATLYKKQFENYFRQWMNQYLPGSKGNVLDSDIPGTTSVKLTNTNGC